MQRIVLTAAVAAVLFGSAIYYGTQSPGNSSPKDPPSTDTPASSTSPHVPAEPDDTSGSESAPRPTRRATTDGVLGLEAATSHGHLPKNETKSFYASVDVEATEVGAGKDSRPPLNIALVVDQSGSMQGKKLGHAREAAHTIVNMMEPSDRLTMVGYSSKARVRFPPRRLNGSATDQAHRVIRRLNATGGTNIEQGIRQAQNSLASAETSETIDRVVLLSDGKPTVGLSSVEGLGRLAEQSNERGISVTTMGVGVDYNETIMMDMAKLGGGNYYFIDAPSKVVSMFQKELGTLAETVAKNASLVIELGDSVGLVNSYGYPIDSSDGRVRVDLSEFYAGQTKSLLLELKGTLRRESLQQVMEIDLSYRDLAADRPAHEGVELTAAATDDPARLAASVDREVVSRVQQIEVASTLSDAMEAYQQGDQQRAEKALERRRQRIRERQKQYDLPEESIDKMDRELEETKSKIQQRAAGSEAGQKAVKREKADSLELIRDSSAF
jgi:Ca-activated chloride channel family protein